MIAELLWQFISAISDNINRVTPYLDTLFHGLILLNITWLGIETAMGKYEFPQLVEKILILGFSIFIIKHLPYFSKTFLDSLVRLSGMDSSILENPAVLFQFAQEEILDPVNRAVSAYMGASKNAFDAVARFFNSIGFYIQYGMFIAEVYICFAIIVVQIVLNYILYYIVLFFGMVLAPFTIFKPLEFIGKNVFKAVLTQALTVAVIVFVATIGLTVFQKLLLTNAIDRLSMKGIPQIMGNMWVLFACILIYCFICLMSPTLVMSIISGAPTLGASGLISTVAAIGGAAMGIGSLIAGGSAGIPAVSPPAPQTAAPGGTPAPAAAAASQFAPRVTAGSVPAVNTMRQDRGALPAPASAPSPFLPPPPRPQLEDKTRVPVPQAPANESDKAFSYRVLS
ncbi:MAG: type IV secretion system protein [Treponema sp.]|jgi:type IV secretion system protein TrbL|nr:type IV secretion system protein [Treponema sp.]